MPNFPAKFRFFKTSPFAQNHKKIILTLELFEYLFKNYKMIWIHFYQLFN